MATALLIVIYLAFISLGLPDSLLGSAWPAIHLALDIDRSLAGVVSIIAAIGTVASSLMSSRLIHKYGTGKVTFASVTLTALALFGISVWPNFIWLCLMAIPLGLGGGNVDAALNNFVALHYESKHMSWLHSFWGVGATTGPLIMSFFLSRNLSWQWGYRTVSFIQIALVVVLFLTLPLWRKLESSSDFNPVQSTHVSNPDTMKVPGVKWMMLAFFSYVAMEAGAGLWGSSYLVAIKGLTVDQGALGVSLYYGGIMSGRMLSGFLSARFDNATRIRGGQGLAILGILALALPLPSIVSIFGLLLIGLGCAPIFPAMAHETPIRFGRDLSQSVMGLQMASSYIGVATMPMLFGFVAKATTVAILPLYLLLMASVMILASESIRRLPVRNEES